jgi:ubiquinone/menaquinone biosynthesis C-methylase UbiE
MTNELKTGDFGGDNYQKRSTLQQSYNSENNEKLIKIIQQSFPHYHNIQPLSIADLGCGHGLATIELLKSLKMLGIPVHEMIGYDISESQIKLANELKQNEFDSLIELSFQQKNITELDEQEKFDLIFSWFALHWVNEENMSSARDKIFNALKPGGTLIFLAIIEKPKLFSLRQALLANSAWTEKFHDYQLTPFLQCNKSNHAHHKGYEDIFNKKFNIDNARSSRGSDIKKFQPNDFANFLKSWLPELRAEKDGRPLLSALEQEQYLSDLINLIKKSPYDAADDINCLSDGTIEFTESYSFQVCHKPLFPKSDITIKQIPALTFWQKSAAEGLVGFDSSDEKNEAHNYRIVNRRMRCP